MDLVDSSPTLDCQRDLGDLVPVSVLEGEPIEDLHRIALDLERGAVFAADRVVDAERNELLPEGVLHAISRRTVSAALPSPFPSVASRCRTALADAPATIVDPTTSPAAKHRDRGLPSCLRSTASRR